MYRFREEFNYEISTEGEQGDIVLTGRHDPTGEEKRIVIPAQEFIGQDWNAVVARYWDALLADLGYVEPPQFPPEEFRIDIYFTSDGDWLRFWHPGSGIALPPVRRRDIKQTGMSYHAFQQKMLDDLARKLIQADVAPQPPKLPQKKAGKPRWSAASRTVEPLRESGAS